METSAITAKGASDYYAMKGQYKPPYPSGTPEHDAYERGWMQSLKRDGGRLVDTSSPLGHHSKVAIPGKNTPNLYELARRKRDV